MNIQNHKFYFESEVTKAKKVSLVPGNRSGEKFFVTHLPA